MKRILLFLLDGYADWESGFVSAKLNKPELDYTVQTISLTSPLITSQGNFSTNIHYSIDSFQAFDDLAALILIGGKGWGDQYLIKGYNPARYDKIASKKITDFVDCCLALPATIIAGICDGATFLADNGYLDKNKHTGNSLLHLKTKAPEYQGELFFEEKQSVYCQKIITANGSAPLEFTREILIALDMLDSEEVNKWYQTYKKGSFSYHV